MCRRVGFVRFDHITNLGELAAIKPSDMFETPDLESYVSFKQHFLSRTGRENLMKIIIIVKKIYDHLNGLNITHGHR